jgi:hypothetical protein
MCKRKNLLLAFAALVLVLYVGAYIGLSRRGYAEADEWHVKGFYYFRPEDSNAWSRKNYACIILFWPANFVDRSIGLGRHPGAEPLWGLGK